MAAWSDKTHATGGRGELPTRERLRVAVVCRSAWFDLSSDRGGVFSRRDVISLRAAADGGRRRRAKNRYLLAERGQEPALEIIHAARRRPGRVRRQAEERLTVHLERRPAAGPGLPPRRQPGADDLGDDPGRYRGKTHSLPVSSFPVLCPNTARRS